MWAICIRHSCYAPVDITRLAEGAPLALGTPTRLPVASECYILLCSGQTGVAEMHMTCRAPSTLQYIEQ